MKTIGILTGGGDAPGLNAVIRSVVKAAILEYGWKVMGIEDGFEGLIKPCKMKELKMADVHGILPKGGTILGTTNRGNPFAYKIEEKGEILIKDYSHIAYHNVQEVGIDALIIVGGDGTLSIAQDFYEMGLNIVGVPKTIDNDLYATEFTFGFDSAVDTATDAVDRLHATAESHHRVMLLEVMGRDAGWIALYSGVAGGADAILIPEIPVDVNTVINKVEKRKKMGKKFSIIVVAEGASIKGHEQIYQDNIDKAAPKRLGGIADYIADEIFEKTRTETRVTVLGHLQRGGSPSAYDRILGTIFGHASVKLVADGKFGRMVALKNNKIYDIELKEATGRLKRIPLDNDVLTAARSMGICFGD